MVEGNYADERIPSSPVLCFPSACLSRSASRQRTQRTAQPHKALPRALPRPPTPRFTHEADPPDPDPFAVDAPTLARCHDLRATGATLAVIALAVGCSSSTVARNLDPAQAERSRRYAKAWKRRHPRRARRQVRRHRARYPERVLAAGRRSAVLELHGSRCHLCGGVVEPRNLHVDHVIPISKGGTSALANLRPAHAACNLAKGDRLLAEHAARIA